MQRNYGSKRDVPDYRDVIRMYGIGEKLSDKRHDLVKCISHVYDQGGPECCMSNVLCSAYNWN